MAAVALNLDHGTHLVQAGTDADEGTSSVTADHPSRLPRIVVRDRMGRVLDTDTSYQRAINAGRLKIARGCTDLGPGEWRLPHAPVPFRPDYSRIGPPVKERTGIGETWRTREADSNPSAAKNVPKTEDKAEESVAKHRLLHPFRDPRTMNLLGHAGTFLAQVEREQSQTTYLPFTLSVPAGSNPKSDPTKIPETAEYVFPGFCTGCQRTSALVFCYGCERDPNPHYHQDKTGRTGGGFAYIKRDRPLFELTEKNPLNWRTMLTNVPYIFYDGLMVPSLEKYGVAARVDGLDKRPMHLRYPDQFLSGLRSLSARDSNLLPSSDPSYLLHPRLSDGTFGRTPVYDMDDGDEEEEGEGSWKEAEWESDSGRGATILDGTEFSSRERQGPDERLDEEESQKEPSSADPEKKRLYQAPKTFQLKKRDSKATRPVSPFRKDRDLNIPKYSGVDIKKSDKKPTQFINVNLGDASWKAPDAFTLKDREDSPERELLRPPTETDDQSRHRKPSAGTKLAPIVANGRPSLSSRKKSSEGEISVDTGKSKKQPDRHGSPDSGVGSVALGPRSLSTVTKEKTSLSGRKSSAEAPENLEDFGIASDEEETEDEEQATTDGKPRQRSKKEASKKERSRDPRRVQRTISPAEEEEEVERRRGGGVTTPVSHEDPSPDWEEEDQPMIFKDHSIPRISLSSKLPEPLPLPKIDPPFPPKMMEFVEPVKPPRDLSTTDVETPPPMVEPPRQRPPAPVIRDKRRSRRISRPMMTFKRQVGAPVPIDEVKDIVDPLDWLAKYCIVHPDRLPLYLRVFSKATSEQVYRYADVPHSDGDATVKEGQGQNVEATATKVDEQGHGEGQGHPEVAGMAPSAEQEPSRPQKTRLTEEEAKRIRNLDCVGVALRPEYGMAGKNEGDLNIDKINYTLDVLIDKYENLQEQLDTCTASKVRMLVDLTRKHFPELANPAYEPQPKKGKKGKKSKKSGEKSKPSTSATQPKQEPEMQEAAADEKMPEEEPTPFGDLDIIARLQEKHLNAFIKDVDLCRLNLEITRLKEKLKDVDDRIDDLEDEKKLLQLYARDEFLQSQTAKTKPEKFIRKQSPLYQKLHPSMDVEMNLSELEEALQQINGHLITRKELQYIFFVLNIPGRRRIDVQMFSVIAALSEKVAQVDPFIRKLINKFDFEALNVKMERSKELFSLLTEDDVDVPLGKIASQMLGVELAAGGVSEEHTKYVLGKFNRENKGIVDFLDFLTYIPLFIEIHNRILDSPLASDRSW